MPHLRPVVAIRSWLSASIQHRVHWYSALLASGILVVFGIAGYAILARSHNQLAAAAQEEVGNLARSNIEWILNDTAHHIGELSKDPMVATALTDSGGREAYLQPLFRDIEKHSPVATRIMLTDYKGEVITPAPAMNGKPIRLAMVHEIIDKGTAGAQLTKQNGSVELVVMEPVIYPATGYPEGAMVGTVNLSQIFDQVSKTLSPQYEYAMLIGDQAHVGKPVPDSNVILVKLAPVHPLDSLPVTLAVWPKETGINDHFTKLGLAFLLAGGTLIGLIFMITRTMSERLTSRLTQLTQAARQVESTGTLALDFPRRMDEVDTLGQVLKNLLERLLANNLELEQRVDERTRELSDSEARYRLLAENATDWITLLDAGGRYLYASPVAETLLGRPAAELAGCEAEAFVHPQDLTRYRESMAKLRQEGGAQHVAYRLRRQNGRYVWVETASHAAGIDSESGTVCVTRDITGRMLAEERIRLLANAFEHTAEGIMVTDARQHIITVNRAFCEMNGYSVEEVIGQTPHIFSSGRHPPEFLATMHRSLNETGEWHGELWNRRKDGTVYPLWLAISTMLDETGAIEHYIAVYSDMTVRKENEAYVRRLAYYDALTDLPNRVLLQDRLQQALIQARRGQTLLAVGFMDLDGFKPVNDQHGHDTGDILLREAARRLLAAVRQGDTVARLGGDEFVVMLPDLTSVQDIQPVADKILAAIARPYQINGLTLRVTASLGFALYPRHADNAETLINQADAAMYQAKRLGKNSYRLFSEAGALVE